MELPEKVIDEITDEIMAELEETVQLAGRHITLDDIEGTLLLYRKKIGERMLQRALESQGTGKLEKKTTKSAKKKQATRGRRKRR